MSGFRLFSVVLVDYQSTDPFLSTPGKLSAIKQLVREHLRELLPENAELVERQEKSGFFCLFLSVEEAMEFAICLQEAELLIQLQFRSLIGVGDVRSESGEIVGDACNVLTAVSRKVPFGETWFVESAFLAMHKDELPWEEIGVVTLADEAVSTTCYRLVNTDQCFLPSALQSVIKKDHHVILNKDVKIDMNFKKNRHVIMTGYKYGEEVNKLVAELPGGIPSSQLWLLAEKLPLRDRLNWLSQNRNLIIATEDSFLAAVFDVNQDTDVPVNPEATMALAEGNLTNTSLNLIGLALPLVPMANIIKGYSYDLLFDGSWGFAKDALLRIEVTTTSQRVIPFQEGCVLNNRPMEVNKAYPLGNSAIIKTNMQTYRFISGVGSPYVGIILGPSTRSMPMKVGDRIELGRQPAFPGFALPDRGGSKQIDWMPGPHAEGAQKNKLTLDRALTGRHHVVVSQVAPFRFSISSMHDKLPSYLLRSNQTKLSKIKGVTSVVKEGILIVGTNIIRMG